MSDDLKDKFAGVYCAGCKSYGCKHTLAERERRMLARVEFGKPDGVGAMLNERGKTHGHYPDQAATADALRHAMQASPNWDGLSSPARDALLMIAVKISRICNGAYDTIDHWEDIAGYATLAADTFRK